MSTSTIEEVTESVNAKSPLNDSQDIFVKGTKEESNKVHQTSNTDTFVDGKETFNTEVLFGEDLRKSFKAELLEAFYLYTENVVPRVEASPIKEDGTQEVKLSYIIKPGANVKLSGSWLTAMLFNMNALAPALCAMEIVDNYSEPENVRKELKTYEISLLKSLFDVRPDLKEPRFLVDFVGRTVTNVLPASGTTALPETSEAPVSTSPETPKTPETISSIKA